MKLYLSSLTLPDRSAFLSLFTKTQNKIGLITNAWGPYPPEKRQPAIDAVTGALTGMGFEIVPINLLEYSGRQAELERLLKTLDGLYVTGGNTFFLNWAMRQAGLHVIIHPLCEKGFVYAGESAGAVVAGKTLHGIERVDSTNDAPVVEWDGLGLVDYGIVPHWDNATYASALKACKQEMCSYAKVKTLTDTDFTLAALR